MPNKSVAAAAAAVALLSAAVAPARAEPVKNVVLVHGAFADGSGWRDVADILVKDGYTVSVVQEPLTSLADDVAATKRVLESATGPRPSGRPQLWRRGHHRSGQCAECRRPRLHRRFHPRQWRECRQPALVGARRQQRHARHQGRFPVSRPGRLPRRFRRRHRRPPRRTSWRIPSRCWPRPPAARR